MKSSDQEQDIKQVIEKASGDVSVLLGAGASAAAGLPAMFTFLENAYGKDFVKNLSSGAAYHFGTQNFHQVTSNRTTIVQRLIHTAGLKKGQVAIDLEDIFEFVHRSPILANDETHLHALKAMFWMFQVCQDQRNWAFDEYKKQFHPFLNSFNPWLTDLQVAVKELRQRMYESYLIDSDQETILDKAAANYSILSKIFHKTPAVVFTTNFDTIFEALRYTRKLDADILTGMGGNQPQHFKWANFLHSQNQKQILVFKLHGSVTWERKQEAIRESFAQLPTPRGGTRIPNVALVEPVLSKRQADSPFREMYRIFAAVLETNRLCVVIGFSFRDDEIREMVKRRLDQKADFRLLIVAPEDKAHAEINEHLEALAAHSRVTWMKEFFGTPEANQKILSVVSESAGAGTR